MIEAVKPNRRQMLAATAAFLVLPWLGLPALAEAQSSAAFLASIYDRYHGESGGVDLSDAAALQRWFTPALAQMIADDDAKADAVSEVPSLDADPFIDAQDGDIADMKITVDDRSDDKAIGHVTFTNFGEAKSITLDLLRVDGEWRVDDIEWAEGTLRGLYTH